MPQRRQLMAVAGALLCALVAGALLREGWTEAGVRIVVRGTARLAVLLFSAAFTASSLFAVWPGAWSQWLLRNRRYLGISFAMVHAVHLLALLCLGMYFPSPFVDDLGAASLLGGGLASACIFAMAATSSNAAVRWLGPARWRRLHTLGSYFVWIVFTQSYLPRAFGDPLYVPFAGLLGFDLAVRIIRRTMRSRVSAATTAVLLAGLGLAGSVRADQADVIQARATCNAESVCTFVVTVRHADVGWKHYADRFEVLGPDGEVLATRVLKHPHVHEQPFTRKLPGVEMPAALEHVSIRAHDSVHGYGGKQQKVRLKRPAEAKSTEQP